MASTCVPPPEVHSETIESVAQADSWIQEFQARRGRPLRILHIGNIANNAYNNAKVQRAHGIHADVLCYDYYHIMGCPEWEDADWEEGGFEKLEDQYHPNWDRIDLGDFQRPAWFVQGPFEQCVERLCAQFTTGATLDSAGPLLEPSPPATPTGRLSLRARLRMLKRRLTRSKFRPVLRALWKLVQYPIRFGRILNVWGRHQLGLDTDWSNRCHQLARQWAELHPSREALRLYSVILDLEYHANLFSKLFPHYDVVQGYSTDAWWPMLCNHKPYTGFEHGTLRDLPFERSLTGQLTFLGYHHADHVFVTNGDCKDNAYKIAANAVSPMLHGIDDRKFRSSPELRESLLTKYNVSRLYLCSIRHDWEVKGTHLHIHAAKLLADRTGKDFRLFMMTWGNDVEKSKALAESLGIADLIVWQPPVPKPRLVRWIGAVDCVLDQVRYPCFGGTAPESLGCGTPVIMSFDPKFTEWIIKEPPPILSAWSAEEIYNHLLSLRDETFRTELGQRGSEWFVANHSSNRNLCDHVRAYAQLLSE